MISFKEYLNEFKLNDKGEPIYPPKEPNHEPGSKQHFLDIAKKLVEAKNKNYAIDIEATMNELKPHYHLHDNDLNYIGNQIYQQNHPDYKDHEYVYHRLFERAKKTP